MIKILMRYTAILLVVLGLAGAAQATPITFFGEDLGLGEGTPLLLWPNATAARTSFLSYLTGVGTETFELQTTGAVAPLALSFPGSSGSITATLTGGGNVAFVVPGTTNGAGRYATSGSRYWEASSTFGITFSSPVSAFGFYGVDIGDFGGQVTVTTTGGLAQLFNVGNTTNGSGGGVLFWGVIDPANSFTGVTFGNTAAGTDLFGFDDMTIGDSRQITTVPEPGAVVLIGFGLLGLGLIRRHRNLG